MCVCVCVWLTVYTYIHIYIIYITDAHWTSLLQSSMRHSQPNSAVGTPAYIAPEVLLRKGYNGKVSSNIYT